MLYMIPLTRAVRVANGTFVAPLTGNDIFAHTPATTVTDQTARTTNNILVGPLTIWVVQIEHDR